MADHKRRKTGKKQPITRHPLFPAIVGLWCGAIAGLCSIAVPTALIERLVSVTRLDSILPMAAPPLGATFRIACALAATALGAFVGGLLSRRLAKPGTARSKVARKARKAAPETAPNTTAERLRHRASSQEPVQPEIEAEGESEAEAALATSAEVEDAQQAQEQDVAEPQQFAAVTASARADETHEAEEVRKAPVAPGILDVSEFDLGEDEFDTGRFATEDPFAPLGNEPAIAAKIETPPATTLPDFDEADFPEANVARQDGAQVFVRNDAPALPTASNEDDAFPAFLLARADTSDGEAAEDISEHQEAIATAGPLHGAQASLSELAHRLGAIPSAGVAPRPGFDLLAGSHGEVEASAPDATDYAPRADMDGPEQDRADEDQTGEDRTGADRDGGNAARRIAASELGSLSHLELLERLALAMTRRRAEIEQAAFETQALAPEATEAALEGEADFVGEAYEAHAHDAIEGDEPEDDGHQTAQYDVDASPNDADDFEAQPVQFLAETPSALDEQTGPDTSYDAVPAAMRPVDPTSFEEEDDDFALPGYIPPRHIGLARPLAPAAEADEGEAELAATPVSWRMPEPALRADDSAEDQDEGEAEFESPEDELEEGYSSLLDLSRPSAPRQEFIRIEEPDSEDIEPVVIFPGEEARRAASFARPGETVAALPRQPEASARNERRFDAPGREDGTRQDNAQTEQALRAALATLQRMSGAA
ncbi:hypothetical protein I5E68_01180 [Novosphingobium sp. YJ-S2-02]|uniref:Uncharacterized protein n=1 Tax=Novosphingobium aureum TaxID=2792964 RepID=A0A931MJC2_9SPHN|nr:hypothetical protein [Novosphingobium aureum]MBH0111563.1 hypothetical protein [Novosphingobium aureum]